jgi:hypothetical protein
MLYLVITTSLIPIKHEERKQQYIAGIQRALENIKDSDIKPVIVENNGKRPTFLDNFGVPVLYTNTNFSDHEKGNKELLDIRLAIDHFKIQNNDLIIKLTGRYLMKSDLFIKTILDNPDKDCYLRYGSYEKPVKHQMNDCITGLIAMKCNLTKKIELITNGSIEWNWAKASCLSANIHIVNNLDCTLFVGLNSVEYNV